MKQKLKLANLNKRTRVVREWIVVVHEAKT